MPKPHLVLLLTIVFCLPVISEEPFKMLRNFSGGPQGWVYASASGGGQPEVKKMGGLECIALEVNFPEPLQLYKERATAGILGNIRIIRVGIYVPADAKGVEISFFSKSKDGLWFHSLGDETLKPGTWNSLIFDLSPDKERVLADGHFGAWEETAAGLSRAIGIQIYSKVRYKGFIGISTIEGRPTASALKPIRFVDLAVPAGNIRVYEKYEITFNVSREFRNPFDPEAVDVWAEFLNPEGNLQTVPAFFFRDFLRKWEEEKQAEVLRRIGRGVWKVRYLPQIKGKHTFKLYVKTAGQTIKSDTYAFSALPPAARGVIGIDVRDPRYFTFSDGSLFYPVGHNVRSPNDPRCANVLGIEVPPDRGTFAYDTFFKKMSDNGENLIEIWMCSWWVGLEWIPQWKFYQGLGYYNMQNAWKLDYLLGLARKHKLYIHLVIDNHGKLSVGADPEWKLSPYNTRQGGILSHPNQFFSDERAKKLYKNRLRYILARWGWSPQIMGFELWSELNLVGHKVHKTQAVYDWHKEMADIIHDYHVPRLVTTHYSGDYKEVDGRMARLKEIDYVVGDGYREKGLFPDLAYKTGQSYSKYKKPGFITEFGGSWNGTTEARLRADLHAGIWSAFFTDMAGVPLFWWFDYVERENLYPHFKAFKAFIKGEDKRGRNLKRVEASCSGKDIQDIRIMSVIDSRGGYVWIYDKKLMYEYPAEAGDLKTLSGISLKLKLPADGFYTVEIWDTLRGKAIEKKGISTDNKLLKIPLPDFKSDCALKIHNKTEADNPLSIPEIEKRQSGPARTDSNRRQK